MTREATPDLNPHPAGPVFLTRDSRAGVLDDEIDLWRVRPDRLRGGEVGAGGECVRILWATESLTNHLGRMTPKVAAATFKTIPETDRECIIWGKL